MRFFILILCGLCAPVFAPVLAAEKLNSVVAIVNNESISRLEIERGAEEMRRQAALRGQQISEKNIREQVLEALIFRLLQLQEARRLGGRAPESAVERRVSELRDEWGAVGENGLRAAVQKKTGLSLEDFREKLREDMEIESAFYREVYSKINVYEEEIDHFLRTESDFVSGREYRLRHILIAAADGGGDNARALAAELRGRAAEGESFADLARQYSAGKNAAAGGDLQWRGAAQLPEAFIAVAQNLNPGEISEIIATGRGFHLLQLTDSRGGVFDADAKRLRLAHIFLPLDAEELAARIFRRLQEGADFAGLAKQYSTDSRSSGNGGDLGWFSTGTLPDYFAPVKTLEEGETAAAPIKSPFGLHLVRVAAVEKMDIETARGRARELLRERRALSQRLDWLGRLRNRAYVVIIDPEFGNLIDGGEQ
ncbi:MAG: hypothetical protein HAW59_01815 [Betaproteobacteria bacterium]|nr:hypothetical protein [Betaproteobacteria bacterium]